MKKKVIPDIVIGIAVGATLVLAGIGLFSLLQDNDPATTVAEPAAELQSSPPEAVQAADQPIMAPAASPKVIINGRTLSAAQIQEMQAMYGVNPAPGNYWYDRMSGMFGVVGEAPGGFMYPGHDFGQLDADASRGNTGVFVNGRNIPQGELMVLNYIWQTYVQPGRYWIDENGYVGYEGSDYPTGNLLVQLDAIARAGGGGAGGDNIWSSRYGGGNSNADNSAGYVSVPGHGPIGYGN